MLGSHVNGIVLRDELFDIFAKEVGNAPQVLVVWLTCTTEFSMSRTMPILVSSIASVTAFRYSSAAQPRWMIRLEA